MSYNFGNRFEVGFIAFAILVLKYRAGLAKARPLGNALEGEVAIAGSGGVGSGSRARAA